MSEKSIENITKSDSNFAPTFADHHLLPVINFNGHCLIKNNISIPKKVINLYISYEIGPQLKNLNKYFTLGNCLFGSVELTKNTDLDKHKYTGYRIRFVLVQNLYLQMEVMEKMLLFLEMIWAHLCILTITEKMLKEVLIF